MIFRKDIKRKQVMGAVIEVYIISFSMGYAFATLRERAMAVTGYRALDPSAIEDRRSMSDEHDAARATSRR